MKMVMVHGAELWRNLLLICCCTACFPGNYSGLVVLSPHWHQSHHINWMNTSSYAGETKSTQMADGMTLWKSRIEGLFLDCEGDWFLGYYGQLRSGSSLESEILGIYRGLTTILLKKVLPHVMIKSDSVKAVKPIDEGSLPIQTYQALIQYSKILLNHTGATLSYIYCEANQSADHLASMPPPARRFDIEDGKSSWPELVGAQRETAEATIERENPLVNAQIVVEGSGVIRNFDCTRIWVWVDDDGVVTRVPVIG